MILNTYITLICNAAEPCRRILALLLALILVFDTNGEASNGSGPEDLAVVLFDTVLPYLLCQLWCFGDVVPDWGNGLFKTKDMCCAKFWNQKLTTP